MDPASPQRICDRLGEAAIWRFFERTMAIIPRPFTDDDRRAWGLFEALVEDNASIGRPEKVIMDFSYKLFPRSST